MVGTKITILWDMTPCGLVDRSAMLDSPISQQTVTLSGKPTAQYRVRINHRRILQNHIFTNTEQKYMLLLPFERGMYAVS